jgi:2-methylisocitrate lyase-like PEP mutase family enzyme
MSLASFGAEPSPDHRGARSAPGATVRDVTTQASKAARFLELHREERPLLMPNPWDQGSARVLASLGFQALATTSSGFAATKGRLDGGVTRDEAIAHAAEIVSATDLPVSADLEDGFADDPAGVAETIRLALDAGLAGCSVEDFTRHEDEPIHDRGLAVERVAAAAEVAHGGDVHLVLTARAENYLHGRAELDDTVGRLLAYQEAGADVLFAPGLRDLDEIRAVVRSVDRPLNVLLLPGGPTVDQLGAVGVGRISVGGAFAYAALAGLVAAAEELRDRGTLDYWEQSKIGAKAARGAFR